MHVSSPLSQVSFCTSYLIHKSLQLNRPVSTNVFLHCHLPQYNKKTGILCRQNSVSYLFVLEIFLSNRGYVLKLFLFNFFSHYVGFNRIIQHPIFCLTRIMFPTGKSRIAGGDPTPINTYPFATSLMTNGGNASVKFKHACGGTILTTSAILSAASCFQTEVQ